MQQVAPPSPTLLACQKAAFLIFLLVWALNATLLALRIDTGSSQWAETLLLLSAVVSSLLTLARRLPLQNVVMTAVLVASISSVIFSVAVLSGIPLGPLTYLESFGLKLFGVLPWPIPLIWIVVLINARGVARLIMRPWRKTNYYGFWVIGLACLLVVLFDLSLEPFAVYTKQFWLWHTPKWVWAWHTAPWVNFLGWFVTALGILAFTTPWLINKQPVKQPMDYQPLILWLLLNGWMIAGNAQYHFWIAAGLSGFANLLVTIWTIRGAQWAQTEI